MKILIFLLSVLNFSDEKLSDSSVILDDDVEKFLRNEIVNQELEGDKFEHLPPHTSVRRLVIMDGRGKILREMRPRGKSRQIMRIPKQINRRLRTQGQFRRILPKTRKRAEESKNEAMRSFIHSSDNAIEEAVLQAVLESSTTMTSEHHSHQLFGDRDDQNKSQQPPHRMTQNVPHSINRTVLPVRNMEVRNMTSNEFHISKIQTEIILSSNATREKQSRVELEKKFSPTGMPKSRHNLAHSRLVHNLRLQKHSVNMRNSLKFTPIAMHPSENKDAENRRSAETRKFSLRTRLSSFDGNKTSTTGTKIKQRLEKTVLKVGSNDTKVILEHRGITIRPPITVSGESSLSQVMEETSTHELNPKILEFILRLIDKPIVKRPAHQKIHKESHETVTFSPGVGVFPKNSDGNMDVSAENISLQSSNDHILNITVEAEESTTKEPQGKQPVIIQPNMQEMNIDTLGSGFTLNAVDGLSSPAPQRNVTHSIQIMAAPGATPPSDFVVNELNNADDFLEVARRLQIFRRRALKRKTRSMVQFPEETMNLKH